MLILIMITEAVRGSAGRFPQTQGSDTFKARGSDPRVIATGVCEKNTPFTQTLALQHSSRNCSPAPDFMF